MSNQDFVEFQNPEDATIDRLTLSLEKIYQRPRLLIWRSFLQGFMSAIGAFIGTAVVVTISGYIFHKLGGIHLFQPFIDQLNALVNTSASK